LLFNIRHGVAFQNTGIFIITLVIPLDLECVLILRVTSCEQENVAAKIHVS
jgi:hypothetical protein